ncbi:MAG TPA: phosphatidate cytidylyltransferase, partial [Candidatus Dormibacteraeota bacterium]|nr:phosphatidate cytidylyltransferase [Candidatus Dormibacteraeota bacterium]
MSETAVVSSVASASVRPRVTKRRIAAGVLIAIVGLPAVFWAPAFDILVLAVGLACLYELNSLCEIKGQELQYPIAVLGVFAYIVLASLGRLQKWEGVLLAGVTIAAFFIGMYGDQRGYFARTAYTLLAVLYIGKLLTYFVFLRQVPLFGVEWTIFALICISFTDIFGMLIGNRFGRRPLTRISPKKTIEGSIGALLVVALVGAAGSYIPALGLTLWQGVALAALTNIGAQAGDLVESALKRDVGVKDTGTAIVGHGGFLDRFDSYI